MIRLGLIGGKLEHSYSPKLFDGIFSEAKVSGSYSLYEIDDLRKLNDIVENERLNGFNVTIPYKEAIIPYLKRCDKAAIEVGAVNTVTVRNGELFGYNTDISGFNAMLSKALNEHNTDICQALILGTGGAAKAVAYVLRQNGFHVILASRKIEDKEWIKSQNLELTEYEKISGEWLAMKVSVIVNATPLGMYPNVNTAPNIDYNSISSNHIALDLVYNPEETLFLRNCRLKGAYTMNGALMLQHQAEEAWKIFADSSIDVE